MSGPIVGRTVERVVITAPQIVIEWAHHLVAGTSAGMSVAFAMGCFSCGLGERVGAGGTAMALAVASVRSTRASQPLPKRAKAESERYCLRRTSAYRTSD